MICPNGQGECRCNEFMQSWRCHPKPPPPTLAEIEGLTEELVDAAAMLTALDWEEYTEGVDAARAALMAAIQKYGRE